MAKKKPVPRARAVAPRVVVLAGPNGAGKSTSAEAILRGPLGVEEFVNADVIAQGLSGFSPNRVAIAAGRVMLARIRELSSRRESFAFETTLASRTFHPWLQRLIADGYQFHLVFLWLPSPDAAIARVAERVRRGGHSVPEETIRRRYRAGLRNLGDLYLPLAATWQIIDNTKGTSRLVANGTKGGDVHVRDNVIWTRISESAKT